MALDAERIRQLIGDESADIPPITAAQAEETARLFRVTNGAASGRVGKKGHGR